MLMSLMSERTKVAPQGLFGGEAGARPHFRLDDGTLVDPKSIATIEPGRSVSIRTHGGGGYGPPTTRAKDQVVADVLDGYVSREAAKDAYGVDV